MIAGFTSGLVVISLVSSAIASNFVLDVECLVEESKKTYLQHKRIENGVVSNGSYGGFCRNSNFQG